jgi:iron(III) transport system permease protein
MVEATASVPAGPGAFRGRARAARLRRSNTPPLLLCVGAAVGLVLLAPLAFLVIQARDVGTTEVADVIWRPLTGTLLWNTVRLLVVVTVLCAAIGTLAAWCVERTDLPGRRMWAVLVVLPFAVPDFVVSFGWWSLTPSVSGFRGAIFVMTMALYPLVYLPVAASLRSADPGLEEAARSLGLGRTRTFLRVTLAQSRRAIVGGSLLVALVLLAEYGAFEIIAYQTFTTEIFTEFELSFDVPAACALSLVLVVLSLMVLAGDGFGRSPGRLVSGGRLAQRARPRHRLGRARIPVFLGFVCLVGLALFEPIGASIYWIVEGGTHLLTVGAVVSAGWHTAAYAGSAAALATAMALPVALLAVRHPGRGVRLLERGTFLVLAMPGLVIALALTFFSERYAGGFEYETASMLVAAYALLFFPFAFVTVRASVAHAPSGLDDAARSLGVAGFAAFRRVTLPLIAPGLAASFCLVFLASVTELTATLVLIPPGAQTLATQFWANEQSLSYGGAAPYGLVIVALAAGPCWVLARFFQRLPARAMEVA